MTRVAPSVRDYDPAGDQAWAEAAVGESFGGPLQARRGEVIDTLVLPGLVAALDGEPISLLLYDPYDHGAREVELALLVTPHHGKGGGTAVVRELQRRFAERPIWLVTTNDNVEALRFYQRLGFRLRELRAGAVDEARRHLKPAIPLAGRHGIPLRDELELVLDAVE